MPITRKKPAAAKPATAASEKSAKTIRPVVARKAPAPKSAPVNPAVGGKAAIEKPVKVKKPKLVRDSFTIPKDEYAVLANLKQRAGQLSNPAKKSELLRAGIKALAALPDAAFLAALKAVPSIKTGRPAKD
jgi:hypothetical protein